MTLLVDSHYHLDFIENLEERYHFLQQLEQEEVVVIAQTVTPSAYVNLKNQGYPFSSLGFHPWWIESSEQVQKELQQFRNAVRTTHLIGEIGLDFSPKRLERASHELQEKVLEELLNEVVSAAKDSSRPYVLSLHSVRSTTEVIRILEETGCYESNVFPILHRFSGTSDELVRHIRLGGYLSIHPQLLQTKKGRAYVQQIPLRQMLLETDQPEKAGSLLAKDTVLTLKQSLWGLVEMISQIRKEEILPQLCDNQEKVFGIASHSKEEKE